MVGATMKLKNISIISILFILCMVFCLGGCENQTDINGKYTAYLSNDDWGCGINKIIISLDKNVENVSKNTFNIIETKEFLDWQNPEQGYEQISTERTILDAYLSDETGNRIENDSSYITVEMDFTPTEGSYLIIAQDKPYTLYPELYNLEIQLSKNQKLVSDGKTVSSINIDKEISNVLTTADEFKIDSYVSQDKIEYEYAYYEPEEKSKNLVVWLHGLCEGGVEGTDPYIACLSNDVSNLIKEDFQNIIGSANILVPQCPTFWMDTTGHDELVNGTIVSDGTSYYTSSLNELIQYYKEKTNSDNVIISGCSNGGFMAMRLAMDYGSNYDAYVLICEAMEDKYISDNDIENLKDLPLYFIYSNDDPTVKPELYEIPTIERLKAANASNLHVTTFDSILDTTGRFKDESGNPYNFGGHSSWIPFLNNEAVCDECGKSAWQWMRSQI